MTSLFGALLVLKKINKQDFYEEMPSSAFKEMLSQKAHAIRQLLLIIAKKKPNKK